MLESFKPEVGFEIQFDVPQNDKIYQHLWKVTDVVPGRKIAYSWKYGGHSGDSVVSFETNPDFARGNFLAGWAALTDLLKDFLASA